MTQVGAQLVSVEAAKELAAADLGGSRQPGVGGSRASSMTCDVINCSQLLCHQTCWKSLGLLR